MTIIADSVQEQKPPSGITGAEITRGVVLDYLSATLIEPEIDEGLGAAVDLFGPIEERKSGFRGYGSSGSILGGKGTVAWDLRRPDMGVHVDLGAQALGEASRYVKGDVEGMLVYMLALGFKPTRVDFAIDDTEGALDLPKMWEYVEIGDVSTRCRVKNRALYKNMGGGFGIAFGARGSDTYLRCYDKKAEQEGKGHRVKYDHWVRVEIELRGKRALAALKEVLDRGLSVVAGLIRSHVEFKERGSVGNISRRPIAPFWERFLEGFAKFRLQLPKKVKRLEDLMGWVEQQVSTSLAAISKAKGGMVGGVGYLLEVIEEGEGRLKDHHWHMIREYQEKGVVAVPA